MAREFPEVAHNNINRKKYGDNYDRIFGKSKKEKSMAGFYTYYKVDGKFYKSIRELAEAFDMGSSEMAYIVKTAKPLNGFQIKVIQTVEKL